jgi:hypothetical protein
VLEPNKISTPSTKYPEDVETTLGDIEEIEEKYSINPHTFENHYPKTVFTIYYSISHVFHPPRFITNLFRLPQLTIDIELTIRAPPLDRRNLLVQITGHFQVFLFKQDGANHQTPRSNPSNPPSPPPDSIIEQYTTQSGMVQPQAIHPRTPANLNGNSSGLPPATP